MIQVNSKFKGISMKFLIDGNQINCVRNIHDEKTGKEKDEVVVSFDAHLYSIAPHVESVLNANELEQLKAWLDDKAVIQTRSREQTLLKAMPSLLEESAKALETLDEIDIEDHTNLKNALSVLNNVLNNKDILLKTEENSFKQISENEALKKQLDMIKKEL